MVKRTVFSLLAAVVMLAGWLLPMAGRWSTASAADPVELTTSYPSVVVKPGDSVTFGVTVVNAGTVGRQVDLLLDKIPDNWNPILRAEGLTVRRVYVEPGKSTKVDLQLKPPTDAKIQDYDFALKARPIDGAAESQLKLVVGVQEKPNGGTTLQTLYPNLKGPSGDRFSFKVDLINDGADDRTYSVTAVGPQGWDISLKPAYESTQVNTLRVKAGETKGLDIQLTPPDKVGAGEYAFTVQAVAGNEKAALQLKVTVTGTYTLGMKTQNDLLNAQATAGEETVVSLQLQNQGSADLNNVSLASTKPDGWSVTFVPAKIDVLAAGATREVQAVIKPVAKAIPGDYMLSMTASNPQASKAMDLRVTVETPTIWGWVGAGIVVAVVVGLFGVFRTFSRR